MLISNINACPEFGNGKYSDHISFSFSLLFHKTSINVNHNRLHFRKLDIFGIQQLLTSINWFTLLNESYDVNTMFDTFYKTLHSILNHYVPNYKPNKSSNNYPKHILKLKQKMLKLFKTRHKSNNTFLIWTSLKKSLSTQIKQITINREILFYHLTINHIFINILILDVHPYLILVQ